MSPDLSLMQLDFSTAFHRYSEPPAVITADFSNGVAIRVYIGPDDAVYAMVLDPNGQPITDKGKARSINMPRVAILAQIGPLALKEEQLSEEYVRRTLDSELASQHFRNQLYVFESGSNPFRQMVQDSWPGVRIRELRRTPQNMETGDKATLSLLVQNDDYVAEVGTMGHGLQMWLQIIWFLARAGSDATVILDEPDVYMHPDLQRRLLRMILKRHRQVIIATHSTEMVADVSPDDILVVERTRAKSGFAPSLPAVQQVIEKLGGVHNLHLARLWSAKRFLLVEGDDLEILGPLHATLFPESPNALQTIPRADIAGWHGWERAVGAASAMRNAFGDEISVYCILDSDFHSTKSINARYVRARQEGINLHVWRRKEIENYLLVPEAIRRVISNRVSDDTYIPTAQQIREQIDQATEQLRQETLSAITDVLFAEDKAAGAGTASTNAAQIVNHAWKDCDTRWAIVSGKRVLSVLSTWSQENYSVSFGVGAIARALKDYEMPEEIHTIFNVIEHRLRLSFDSSNANL